MKKDASVTAEQKTTVADQLEAAAVLLEKGWTQGDRDGIDMMCVIVALDSVSNSETYIRARRFISDVVGTSSLILWNDTPGRTQAEVVAAVRKAAELARSA